MVSDPGVSPGEIGGVFAGLIALLAALGKGFAWLMGWRERHETSRAEKLQAWHDELEQREAGIEARVNARLEALEQANITLSATHADLVQRFERQRIAYRLIAAELSAIAPHSAALLQARAILIEPIADVLSSDAEILARIDAADKRAGEHR